MVSLPNGDEMVLAETMARYEAERQKRLRPDGIAQFVDLAKSEKYRHFADDPWITPENKYARNPMTLPDGTHTKVLVTGAGYAALLFAVRLMLEADFQPEDIILVDSAWGFGGTWYWNRFPGLMCDVESSCYLPLLEETGFVPKHRYSYGTELREYAELVASKYGLDTRAAFGSTVQATYWDEVTSEWVTTIKRELPSAAPEIIAVRSDFFLLTSGLLSRPKLARLNGLDDFKGHMFHTSRWDYSYTGGSDASPNLEKLRDKSVAFIGTGATAVQAVPALAKWAKELHVFQRTASAVDVRDQRPIEVDEWNRSIASSPGWQRERRENMAAFLSDVPDRPAQNLVNDGWTHFPSYAAMVGGPKAERLNHDNVAEYVGELYRIDLPRQAGIRARAARTVKDSKVAESLMPWYAGWCKRPCFHDEYLGTFNLPNVRLVDTDGKGVDCLSANGVCFNGHEYRADLVIFGTGFESFTVGSPAHRAGIVVTGRDHLSMDDKWDQGVGTFHGVFSRGFPNLILPGLRQAGTTVNAVHIYEVLAQHVARILSLAKANAPPSTKKLVIEPTAEAELAWSYQVASGAYAFGGLSSCTPSYTTAEGRAPVNEEEEIRAALGAPFSTGILEFTRRMEAWEAKGDLSELEITTL